MSKTKRKAAKNVAYDAITQEQYRALQQAADFFNGALFAGSLKQSLFTFQRKGRMLGYFSPDRFNARAKDVATTHEIALNPDGFTGRSDEEIFSTVVHEQVHQWQLEHGDPGRPGYHNKQWAAKMIEVGLQASDTGQPGGHQTGQRMSHYIIAGGRYQIAYAELAKRGLKLDWQSKPRERNQRNSKTKFSCPKCGKNFWAAPGAKWLCFFCGVLAVAQSNVAYETTG